MASGSACGGCSTATGPRTARCSSCRSIRASSTGPPISSPNPAALDTDFQFRLALEGHYSAIALGIGLAEKYMKEYCGRVPLILKLNGKTNIPDDAEAVSPLSASVEDAVRLGADAVGYTLYVGSPRQDAEIREFLKVRQDCERLGHADRDVGLSRAAAPSTPRAARARSTRRTTPRAWREELGADIVKLHEPEEDNERSPEPYRSLREDAGRAPAPRGALGGQGARAVLRRRQAGRRRRRVLRKIELYMESGRHGRHVRPQHVAAPVRRRAGAERQVHAILRRHTR